MKKTISILTVIVILCLNFSFAVIAAPAYQQKWDSRDFGWVTPVKDQQDGICWAYAICAAAETDAIAHGYVSSIDFSEGYLYAIHNLYSDDADGTNNTGDSPRMIINTSLAYNALAFEKDYPYSNVKKYSQNELVKNTCKYTISSAGRIKKADVKKWIAEHGAVICGLNMPQIGKNPYVNNGKDANGENHVVTIIGWDDNLPADKFKNKPSTNGAWLCKNSWGTDSGDNGFFWLSFEDNTITDFTGISVSLKSCLYRAGTLTNKWFQIANIDVDSGSADSLGVGNLFAVKANTLLDSFSVLINENQCYKYKIYLLDETPSISNINDSNLIKTGNAYSDFQDISLQTIDINYTTTKDCYIFIEIISPAGSPIVIAADDISELCQAYYLQHFDGTTFYIKPSDNAMRIGLNLVANKKPLASNTETTKEELFVTETEPNTKTIVQTATSENNRSLLPCFLIVPIIINILLLCKKSKELH